MSIIERLEKVLPVERQLAAMQIDFECMNCGKCCTGMEGIAYNSIDINRMAKHLGLTNTDILRNYTVQSEKKKSDRWLKTVGENRACQWRGEHGCTVYEGRGQVCRFYPYFTTINLQAIRDHKPYHVAGDCPGQVKHFRKLLVEAMLYTPIKSENFVMWGNWCILKMIAEEGKVEMAIKGYKEYDVLKIPTYEELKPIAHMVAIDLMKKIRGNKLVYDLKTFDEMPTASLK